MPMDHPPVWVSHITERAALVQRAVQSDTFEHSRGQPWSVVRDVKAFAGRENIPMLITEAKMLVIKDILSHMSPPPKVILEFGTYIGSSAIGWGAILQDLNNGDKRGLRVYSFEMDPNTANCARDLIRLSGLDDVITVMHGRASESLRKLVAQGDVQPGSVDMAFIDHWEKYYLPDLQLCEDLRLFHEGSVACADNTDNIGAPAYLKHVRGGGSGKPGAVKYSSEAVRVLNEQHQSIVEVSTVVDC